MQCDYNSNTNEGINAVYFQKINLTGAISIHRPITISGCNGRTCGIELDQWALISGHTIKVGYASY